MIIMADEDQKVDEPTVPSETPAESDEVEDGATDEGEKVDPDPKYA